VRPHGTDSRDQNKPLIKKTTTENKRVALSLGNDSHHGEGLHLKLIDFGITQL
jgi:hypothetical protein